MFFFLNTQDYFHYHIFVEFCQVINIIKTLDRINNLTYNNIVIDEELVM